MHMQVFENREIGVESVENTLNAIQVRTIPDPENRFIYVCVADLFSDNVAKHNFVSNKKLFPQLKFIYCEAF